jgi:hypothetical protein
MQLTYDLGFEKYFSVVERGTDVGEEYYRIQYMKFFVMYSVSVDDITFVLSNKILLANLHAEFIC